MKSYLLPACLLMLLITSCGADLELIELKNDEGQVTEQFNQRKDNNAKEGAYKSFFDSGDIKEKAEYKNGLLVGERILYYNGGVENIRENYNEEGILTNTRTIYYENGKIEIIESYQNGLFEGKYQVFYEDGELKSEANYVNNEIKGEWRSYYPDGVLKEILMFEKNEENGPFKEYHPNGNLKAEGAYVNGDNENGEIKLYNESGEHIKTMECDFGRCTTTWELEK